MKRMYISYDLDRGYWVVRLGRPEKVFIGRYKTQEHAVKARNKAMRERGLKIPD